MSDSLTLIFSFILSQMPFSYWLQYSTLLYYPAIEISSLQSNCKINQPENTTAKSYQNESKINEKPDLKILRLVKK